MAYVDISTEKIVDAQEGTLTYYHEEGHIVFSKTDKYIKNSFKQSFYFTIGVTCLPFAFLSKILFYASIVFILIYWYYYFYEEIWCWNYAFKRKKLKGGIEKDGMEKSKASQ